MFPIERAMRAELRKVSISYNEIGRIIRLFETVPKRMRA
jgi:hypothetical protein